MKEKGDPPSLVVVISLVLTLTVFLDTEYVINKYITANLFLTSMWLFLHRVHFSISEGIKDLKGPLLALFLW